MLNALRLSDGFDQSLFESRTGLSWVHIADQVERACKRELLESAGYERWRPTDLGRRFLNDLVGIFLSDA
jgi:coproporphyrinogen III oxidase-like Fe-S oxidoreductase